MNGEILQKPERGVARRSFLRDSGLVAGDIAGMAAMSPVISFAQATQRDNTRRSAAPSLSRQFARWVIGLRYEDLPPAAVDRAKGLSLHALASVLLGSQVPGGREAVNLITEEEAGVRNGSTIMVSGAKATKGGAAFANSALAAKSASPR